MVSGIVHVQVGQCGNQICNAFWNTMSAEHKLAKMVSKFLGNKENIEDVKRFR